MARLQECLPLSYALLAKLAISASSIILTTCFIPFLAFHPRQLAAFDGSTLFRKMSVGRIKCSSIVT